MDDLFEKKMKYKIKAFDHGHDLPTKASKSNTRAKLTKVGLKERERHKEVNQ